MNKYMKKRTKCNGWGIGRVEANDDRIMTGVDGDEGKKYQNAIADAVADLGQPAKISQVFAGFQQYLYPPSMAG